VFSFLLFNELNTKFTKKVMKNAIENKNCPAMGVYNFKNKATLISI